MTHWATLLYTWHISSEFRIYLIERNLHRLSTYFDISTSHERNMASITAFPDSNGYTKSFALEETTDLLKFFEEFGFVVVRNIIESTSQIEDTIDEIWNILRVLNPKIDKNDSSTWDDKYWPVYMGLKDGEYTN